MTLENKVLFYFIFLNRKLSFTLNSTFIKLNYKLVYFPKYFSHGPIFDKGNVNVYSKISVKDDLLWSILNKKKVYINEMPKNSTKNNK